MASIGDTFVVVVVVVVVVIIIIIIIIIITLCKQGEKCDWDFRISDLVKNPDGTDI